MLKRFIGVEGIHPLWMMRIRRRLRPGPGRPSFRVNYYAPGQQAATNCRRKSENRRGCETSRVCDVSGRANCIAIRLGQAIYKITLELAGVILFVELFENIRIVDPKIARQIDGLYARRKLWNQFQGLSVRQSEKGDVYFRQRRKVFRRLLELKIGQAEEIFVNRRDSLAGVLVGGDQHYLGVRMEKQYSQQLAAAVAGAAEYRDPEFVC